MKHILICAALGAAVLAAAAGPLLAGHRGGMGRGFAGRHGGNRAMGRHYRRHGGTGYASYGSAPVVDGGWATVAESEEVAVEEEPYQNQRYLKVKNDTGQKLTVWVRYRSLDGNGDWAWLPGSGDAMEYQLEPGQETYLAVDDRQLCASRVHIWAETADGQQMDEYREQDLWLVPEKDDNDEHWYAGSQVEDFTFTVSAAG
jgi:hypothetical protein